MENCDGILQAIGHVESPYADKFAIPRQPGLAPSVISKVVCVSPFSNPECFDGLDQFSHLWIVFQFHHNVTSGWKPKVRPPRLGGNDKLGVFATRSTFRPNSIGMSVGKLERHYKQDSNYIIELGGLDLANETPVLDIKPYIGYSDSIPQAQCGVAQSSPELICVEFSERANVTISKLESSQPRLRQQLVEILSQDPRPAYRKLSNDDRTYGMSFAGFNIRWQVKDNISVVTEIDSVG